MADLVLTATTMELELLKSSIPMQVRGEDENVQFEVCGFGPITAASRATFLIHQYSPARVVLAGIAGTFDPKQFPVGTATIFSTVHCWGVGVGMQEHRTAGDIGFDQFNAGDVQIGDSLELDGQHQSSRRELLTACAASDNDREAMERSRRFPGVIAEDMEGFGVAVSCHMSGVPLAIVRGASNIVGCRDKQQWRIDDAMTAVGKTVSSLLGDRNLG